MNNFLYNYKCYAAEEGDTVQSFNNPDDKSSIHMMK